MDTKYGYKIEWQFVNVYFWCTRYPIIMTMNLQENFKYSVIKLVCIAFHNFNLTNGLLKILWYSRWFGKQWNLRSVDILLPSNKITVINLERFRDTNCIIMVTDKSLKQVVIDPLLNARRQLWVLWVPGDDHYKLTPRVTVDVDR